MSAAGQQQRLTQPTAGCRRRDAEYVDLSKLILVLLGPMEADHGVVDRRDKETCCVEPRLGHPIREVITVDQRLLGMMRERSSVDAQPLLLILTGHEGADLYIRGTAGAGNSSSSRRSMISNSRRVIPAAAASALAAWVSPIAQTRNGLGDSMISRCSSKVPIPCRLRSGETTSWPPLHSVPDSSWA